jgi:hypothetical protein
MEQNIQQTEKVVVPIKTNIAAISMITWGILTLLPYPFLTLNETTGGEPVKFYDPLVLFLLANNLFLIAGIFLKNKKKWAWKFSLIIYTIFNIFFIVYFLSGPFYGSIVRSILGFFVLLFLYDIPLILLFFDRKNFLKVAN